VEKEMDLSDKFAVCRICGPENSIVELLSLFEENRAELVRLVTKIDVSK
jgi:hypothetical protein